MWPKERKGNVKLLLLSSDVLFDANQYNNVIHLTLAPKAQKECELLINILQLSYDS